MHLNKSLSHSSVHFSSVTEHISERPEQYTWRTRTWLSWLLSGEPIENPERYAGQRKRRWLSWWFWSAKVIFNCSSGNHRKRLTTEAARIRSKSNREKQSSIVRQAITTKDSRQKPQGFAAKAIVTCSSGDHRKRLTTEAARPDSQQKQSLVVRQAITAKDSRQKPQGLTAKAMVSCS